MTQEALRRGGKLVATPNEESVYKALGLPFIPPELREGTDEIARARKGALPDSYAWRTSKASFTCTPCFLTA